MFVNDFLEAIRRNHALEHATIAFLVQRQRERRPLAGHSHNQGFNIFGQVATEDVEAAISEALTRLNNGEVSLALSPFCGTSILVTGIMAGGAALLTVGSKNRMLNLPRALSAAVWGVLGSQPVGILIQRYVTTSARMNGMEIAHVRRLSIGSVVVHSVHTT